MTDSIFFVCIFGFIGLKGIRSNCEALWSLLSVCGLYRAYFMLSLKENYTYFPKDMSKCHSHPL